MNSNMQNYSQGNDNSSDSESVSESGSSGEAKEESKNNSPVSDSLSPSIDALRGISNGQPFELEQNNESLQHQNVSMGVMSYVERAWNESIISPHQA